MKILLTGSTGYIGGRLAPLLLKRGHEIVCAVREPRKLAARAWASDPRVRIVKADIADTDALADAMRGCDAAYYLVHSMESGTADFASRDHDLANSFARAASIAGIGRIIYLGGLGELGSGLSLHLRSRREVELALAQGGVPVTTFRAAMIIGSGSASFEILRYLVERLPVMVTPRWVSTRCQPVSVVDVLGYLMDCLDEPKTIGRCLEIGGPVILSYRELMAEMARQLELPRRIVIPLPVLTPKLSSLWIGLITPVSPAVARPLAEGLRNEVIVHDKAADELMPRTTLAPSEAIERALRRVRDNDIPTRWSAAGVVPGDPDWAGGKVFTDRRTVRVAAPADAVFAAICRIGGGNGWYAADYLWRLRGLLDKIIGGPGLRRGRRHPETVEYGETLDFWRVIDVRPAQRLALLAEMKLPGEATLTFDIEPDGDDQLLTMAARFRPKGLLGLAYWYAVLPLHHFVFRGMLRGIASAAEDIARQRSAA
jgi:uncharacterized protein YbjT (DUF2867 family)